MTWLDELYPDVREAGCLRDLLQPLVVVPIDPGLDEPGAEWSVSVTSLAPLRQHTSVVLGRKERVFIVELRAERAHLASGSAREIDLITELINDLHTGEDLAAVLERHAFLKVSSVGKAYLSGAEVDWWWNHLLDPQGDAVASLPRLRDAIRATSRQPKLRRLRPFTSTTTSASPP